jgi:hypothetical protein
VRLRRIAVLGSVSTWLLLSVQRLIPSGSSLPSGVISRASTAAA